MKPIMLACAVFFAVAMLVGGNAYAQDSEDFIMFGESY